MQQWAIQSDINLNGGLDREECQNVLKLGIETVLNYPDPYNITH